MQEGRPVVTPVHTEAPSDARSMELPPGAPDLQTVTQVLTRIILSIFVLFFQVQGLRV